MGKARWIGAALLGAVVSLAAASASAQMVRLRPGFGPDPMTRGGISGGPLPAQQIDPRCRGYVPNAPQQRMMVLGPMSFLRVWVQSSSDTTLMVRAPNGQLWCADDTYGNNPGVDIQGAMPGMYEVYVGSYSSGNSQPYTVGFTQNPSSTPGGGAPVAVPVGPPGIQPVYNPPAPPVAVPVGPPAMVPVAPPPSGGQAFALAPGFMPDPRMFSGVSGGPVPAMSMGPQCRGSFSPTPNHSMYLTSPFNFLRVYATSSGDTTLAIRTPSGQIFCADDTYGLNPGVDLNMAMPGQYQIYVGSYASGANYPYTLALTQSPAMTPNGPTAVAPPPPPPVVAPPPMGGAMYGTLGLATGFMPDPRMMTGVAGGPVSAQSMDSSCRGYIGMQPSHMLYLNTGFNFLRVYVASQTDTTLMIRAPTGQVYCADDTYNFNPAIDLRGAPPGPYQVFVGTYSAGNQAPYSIGFTELPYNHP